MAEEDGLRPRPQRSEATKTVFRGHEIGRAIDSMGLSLSQLARVTGMNPNRIRREILEKSQEDDLPKIWDLILFAFYHHPELRTLEGDIPLPIAEWGINSIEQIEEQR